MTSLVRKSAPIVALYWLLNRLLTYWFIREVLPTLWVCTVSGRVGLSSGGWNGPRVAEDDDLRGWSWLAVGCNGRSCGNLP